MAQRVLVFGCYCNGTGNPSGLENKTLKTAMQQKQPSIGAVFAAAALMLFISAARCCAQSPYVPLFQYYVFYNLNLEVDPGAAFVFNGPVFSNAGIWSGSSTVTFASTVWAVDQAVNGPNDPFVSYVGTGSSTYTVRGQPLSGMNHVTMPVAGTNDNPNVVEAILQWPPSAYALGSAAAYTTEGETYLANQADLIISNAVYGTNYGPSTFPAGTNFFVYYQDPYYQSTPYNNNKNNWCSSIVWMTNDFYIISNTTSHSLFSTNYVPASLPAINRIWYAGYSFLTNVLFYDWREGWNGGNGYAGKGKAVWAVQFDVSKFNTWLTNSGVNGGGNFNELCNLHNNHPIGKVYVYNSVALTTMNLPAVRVVNGSKLPDSYGLSIATPMPLYVLGNFNTTIGGASDAGILGDVADSWPASFLADAITVLSSAWNDATIVRLPTASSPITVNAACLAGIVPSSSSVGTTDETQYSGGVENYFRFLESWGIFCYNGSIAAMFPSQYATNRWLVSGNYYNAPNRQWSFDTNFVNLAGLPPFTPLLINSNAAPTLAAQPENEFVLAGQATNFTVSASGVPVVSYQWSFDGTNISGATNALLLLTDIQVTNAGDYAVEVSNVLGSVISSNALLSVYTSAVPVLNALSFSPLSGAEFEVSGVPGFNYTVQASTNLVDWTPLMTSNSPFIFADTNANLPQRFYRSVYVP